MKSDTPKLKRSTEKAIITEYAIRTQKAIQQERETLKQDLKNNVIYGKDQTGIFNLIDTIHEAYISAIYLKKREIINKSAGKESMESGISAIYSKKKPNAEDETKEKKETLTNTVHQIQNEAEVLGKMCDKLDDELMGYNNRFWNKQTNWRRVRDLKQSIKSSTDLIVSLVMSVPDKPKKESA